MLRPHTPSVPPSPLCSIKEKRLHANCTQPQNLPLSLPKKFRPARTGRERYLPDTSLLCGLSGKSGIMQKLPVKPVKHRAELPCRLQTEIQLHSQAPVPRLPPHAATAVFQASCLTCPLTNRCSLRLSKKTGQSAAERHYGGIKRRRTAAVSGPSEKTL